MACSKCKETNNILNSESSIVIDFGGRSARVFSDLRFDLDNNQLDICTGFIDDETGEVIEGTSEWSDGLDITHCPFCGKELN